MPRAALVEHIEDQGSFPMQCFARLNYDEKTDVLEQVAAYAVKLVKGIGAVQAERDGYKLPRVWEAPAVIPGQLVEMRPGIFVRDVLERYHPHLSKHWTEALVPSQPLHRSRATSAF